MDSEEKGNKLSFRDYKHGEVLFLPYSQDCSEIVLGGFCCLRDEPQILVFLQGKKRQFCVAHEFNLCTLVEIQGRKGHVWRRGIAAASLSFDFSLPQAKEELAPRNSHVETTAG